MTTAFHDEIAAFFANYVDAFARRDANALSEHWEAVGLFPSPSGNFAMPRDAFRAHCVTLMDFYDRQGVVQPLGELLSTEEWCPYVAQAHGRDNHARIIAMSSAVMTALRSRAMSSIAAQFSAPDTPSPD
jgi:hypothetical protein